MSEWRDETWAIRCRMEPTGQAEHSVPVYLTSGYQFDGAEQMRAAFADEISHQIYGRCTNLPARRSPFDAWVISKGMETLALGVERQSANAHALAERLKASPDVESVRYPFLPSHPPRSMPWPVAR